ncbi:Uncharacterised protein [Mycobacteroides abscessus subsp. abscessus]|nr:Uncharacterised protein [Mycobacteroides abscessus subsp. abscessus]
MNTVPGLALEANPEKYPNPRMINGITVVNSSTDTRVPAVPPSISVNRSAIAVVIRPDRAS